MITSDHCSASIHVFYFISRNVHSRSAGRPTITLLKELGELQIPFTALPTTVVCGIKLQLPLTATRCRQGPAPCVWWQTVCCIGGSEGWVLFLHTAIHHQEWPGAATLLLGFVICLFLICCPTSDSFQALTCQIEAGCLLSLSQLMLSPRLLMIHDGFLLCFPP